jgi:hypothetical protein
MKIEFLSLGRQAHNAVDVRINLIRLLTFLIAF